MKGLIPLVFAVFAAQLPVARGEFTLGKESPFLPPPNAGAQGPQEQAVLEFRGVMNQGGEAVFNIVDLSTKKSAWVRKGQAGYSFKVVEYRKNGDDDAVIVEAQGRRLDLALAKPKTGKAAPVAAKPLPTAQLVNGVQNQGPITPVVLNPTPADNNKAMEDTIAEVRRRRLLRQQQGGVTPPAGTAQPVATPGSSTTPPPPPPPVQGSAK